ncbi:hypothetical protein nbrc107696_13610 [Gordonia spumicola]|uniref:Lipoprotein n=1 Tax=Gordonia spumicola TaxID=589161 RepID=A0A7I9V6A1_9ACTN|nr:hypothetical protein [Gordonia spumicola]GEE00915.1 hypothetical protein nbrc107696_13610 [Gordonia spumicola]
MTIRTRSAAAVGCIVLTVTSVIAAGPAGAATQPTVSVTFSGSTDFRFAGNSGSGTSCKATVDGNPLVLISGTFSYTGPGIAGDHAVRVVCDGGVSSNTVHYYAPRNPLNDIRTQFSNSSQGMFGS